MPVRLNKALKELNVGLSTVADFLQKKGKPLENVSPNAKITDEQYQLLMDKYYKGDKSGARTAPPAPRAQTARPKNNAAPGQGAATETTGTKRQEFKVVGRVDIGDGQHPVAPIKPEKPQTEPQPEAKEETKPQPQPEVKEEIKPEPQPEPQPEVKEETKPEPQPQPEAKEETQPEPQPQPQPEVKEETKPQPQPEPQPEVKEETKPQPQPEAKPEAAKEDGKPTVREVQGGYIDEHGVFHPKSAAPGVQLKPVGFIDLGTLNTSTRPDKTSAGATKKRKRSRITNKERIDVNAAINQQQTAQNQAKRETPGNARQQQTGTHQRQKPQQNTAANTKGKKNKKAATTKPAELSEEEISKQVKETLARLTSKQTKKGVKYRKDKREAVHSRMLEQEQEESAKSKILKLTEFVTANELATMMDVPVTKVIGTCMSLGMMVSINQRLDAETINIVAEEFGFATDYVSEDISNAIQEEEDDDSQLEPRAPIITVMGHVDHGKTSLLDYIRKTNVIAGEAGGITQHIGAYNVKMPSGKRITFLDTPGHEAFTAMRARGAQVTDIAIIIIAADDGVMPQTKEAISHAVAAGVPMVFAINKIDKPGADPEKIKQELANMNYLVEDWGGKYQSQEIAAKKGTNVDLLMEKVLLEAEILDLKANPNRKATGSVIESSLDKGRGYVATVLVQNGTLKQGDVVLAGTHYGRIRGMFNERGQRINEVRPAEPALILGLNGAPTAGDAFHVMATEQEARELAGKREQLKREQGIRTTKRKGLENIAHEVAIGGVQDLNLVVKGDVDGSIEALSDALIKLSTEKIKVNIIYKAVGQISESDVDLAKASNAIIIGFQVRPSQAAKRLAEQEGVDIRIYSVIYDTTQEIRSAMEGMLAPEIKEENTGTAEVRQVFNITKVGKVAGAFVTDGKVHRSDKVRVIRDGIVVHTGSISALKRFKDDVKEVGVNFDCGISIVNYNDVREGDILETFVEVEVKQKL